MAEYKAIVDGATYQNSKTSNEQSVRGRVSRVASQLRQVIDSQCKEGRDVAPVLANVERFVCWTCHVRLPFKEECA